MKSGRQDLNLRSSAPKADGMPDLPTPGEPANRSQRRDGTNHSKAVSLMALVREGATGPIKTAAKAVTPDSMRVWHQSHYVKSRLFADIKWSRQGMSTLRPARFYLRWWFNGFAIPASLITDQASRLLLGPSAP